MDPYRGLRGRLENTYTHIYSSGTKVEEDNFVRNRRVTFKGHCTFYPSVLYSKLSFSTFFFKERKRCSGRIYTVAISGDLNMPESIFILQVSVSTCSMQVCSGCGIQSRGVFAVNTQPQRETPKASVLKSKYQTT